jgi:hypothetical protein
MFLTRSTGRKIVATATAAVTFTLLYEVTILDSRYAARQAELRESTAAPAPGPGCASPRRRTARAQRPRRA